MDTNQDREVGIVFGRSRRIPVTTRWCGVWCACLVVLGVSNVGAAGERAVFAKTAAKMVSPRAGAGPGSSTIDDEWGGRTFTFPDPCGIDVAPTHQVMVADDGSGYVWQLWGPNPGDADQEPDDLGSGVHAIEIDRDVSASTIRHVESYTPFAEAFNMNALSGGQAAYHGGLVFGLGDGTLELDLDWTYFVNRHYPQRVILSNAGTDHPYSSEHQVADRVIELEGLGWEGVPLRLRLVDPPDLAPYAPEGGWPSAGDPDAAVPPYEGNDNLGYADPEYGLSASAGGPWSDVLDITPGGDDTYTAYLKVPARYSGDNFQVEVTKCDPGGTPLPQRIVGMSSIYTSWKRILIERDRMFRRGGVLFADYLATDACGGGGEEPDCGFDVYQWADVAVGDTIVLFDETNTYEAGGETLTVASVGDPAGGIKYITVNEEIERDYAASDPTGDPPMPSFSDNDSAGIGVISGCDADPNQVNASDSCFFQGDLRGVEQAYSDGFVEVFAPRRGMSVLPYVNNDWFIDPSFMGWMDNLSATWFFSGPAPNAAHLLGGSSWLEAIPPDEVRIVTGHADSIDKWLVVLRLSILAVAPGDATPEQVHNGTRETTDHELGHLFQVNPCATDGQGNPDPHCDRFAWCEGVECGDGELCIMNKQEDGDVPTMWNDVHRFCEQDLFLGDPTCSEQSPDDGSIRGAEAPL